MWYWKLTPCAIRKSHVGPAAVPGSRVAVVGFHHCYGINRHSHCCHNKATSPMLSQWRWRHWQAAQYRLDCMEDSNALSVIYKDTSGTMFL